MGVTWFRQGIEGPGMHAGDVILPVNNGDKHITANDNYALAA